MVKNLPCKAGHTGMIPGQGTKISHATKQLNEQVTTTNTEACVLRGPHITTTEPTSHN